MSDTSSWPSRADASVSALRRLAIIGVGNPLRGDDGVGPRLVALLRSRPLPPGVVAIDGGTGGFSLLFLLEEGWERVIIVDAADVGRAAGEFVRFTPEEVHLAREAKPLSLHNAGLSEVLALAEALGRPLPPIVLFGVQPASLDWREGLSEEVERALPALLKAVLAEVQAATQA